MVTVGWDASALKVLMNTDGDKVCEGCCIPTPEGGWSYHSCLEGTLFEEWFGAARAPKYITLSFSGVTLCDPPCGHAVGTGAASTVLTCRNGGIDEGCIAYGAMGSWLYPFYPPSAHDAQFIMMDNCPPTYGTFYYGCYWDYSTEAEFLANAANLCTCAGSYCWAGGTCSMSWGGTP